MKIAHISDTHILTLKRHDEFREVFEQIYKTLREENVKYIVHTGDLFHSKLQLTPECVTLAAEFLKSLADIAPTFIIAGNHDTNLRNNKRLDSISPIVDAMNYQNLYYLKNSGPEYTGDVVFNVLSIFDKENWVKFKEEDEPNFIKIALYHGAIKGVVTDTGYAIEHGDDDVSIFEGHDYAMLGDIHLANQKVDDEGRVRYAGSTIQNNFGEEDNKGFLIWDIKDKNTFSVKHHTIKCPKPFATIKLASDGELITEPVLPKGARIRLVSEFNLPIDRVKTATDYAKSKYKPESVTYVNKATTNKESLEEISNLSKTLNLRDLGVQEELIAEFLKDYNPDSETLEKIYTMNRKYASQAEQNEDIARNVKWKVKSLEWDNLFNYGEGNSLDFTKLNGIVGVLGKNASGKSSIWGSLLYTIFNNTDKNSRKNLNIINQTRDLGKGRVVLDIDGTDYVIERKSEKYIKKSKGVESTEAKTDVEFTTEAEGLLTGLDRSDTDKAIRKYVGTIDDFLLTTMASQFNSLSFINEGSTNRKSILAKFLDLDIFEAKFKLAKADAADAKAVLKKLDGTDFDAEINATKEAIKNTDLAIEDAKELSRITDEALKLVKEQLLDTQSNIKVIKNSVPDVASLVSQFDQLETTKDTLEKWIDDNKNKLKIIKEKLNGIESIEHINIADLLAKKATFDALTKNLSTLESQYKLDNNNVLSLEKRVGLLKEVPCGSEFSHCKFIKDAYTAQEQIEPANKSLITLNTKIWDIEDQIAPLRALKLEETITKYNSTSALLQKLLLDEKTLQLTAEKHKVKLADTNQQLKSIEEKLEEAKKHEELIKNLDNLLQQEKQLKAQINDLELKSNGAVQKITSLYKESGYHVSKLESLEEQKVELTDCRKEYAAYDLYLKAMHPNGISYQVIKNKLPVINSEINKILTNIVDFQVYLNNDDDKLDIMIKHPKFDPRPLDMGSGAEKSLASIAIRLALLTVSSLPTCDMLILDEPGTSLDGDNLAGFIRILDLLKGYFKVVFLVSHLDILKDTVDMQINIEQRNNYAYVGQ
jgi:DNA repair exonuclease SbcCD ATPase subunit/DNA repair exonuclease SbcCD nuclease subunit